MYVIKQVPYSKHEQLRAKSNGNAEIKNKPKLNTRKCLGRGKPQPPVENPLPQPYYLENFHKMNSCNTRETMNPPIPYPPIKGVNLIPEAVLV